MQHAATHRGAVPLPAFRCTTGFVVDTVRWLGLPLARIVHSGPAGTVPSLA